MRSCFASIKALQLWTEQNRLCLWEWTFEGCIPLRITLGYLYREHTWIDVNHGSITCVPDICVHHKHCCALSNTIYVLRNSVNRMERTWTRVSDGEGLQCDSIQYSILWISMNMNTYLIDDFNIETNWHNDTCDWHQIIKQTSKRNKKQTSTLWNEQCVALKSKSTHYTHFAM